MAIEADEERAWQMACRDAGLHGLVWALVRVLIRQGVVSLEDVQAALQAEAGVRLIARRGVE